MSKDVRLASRTVKGSERATFLIAIERVIEKQFGSARPADESSSVGYAQPSVCPACLPAFRVMAIPKPYYDSALSQPYLLGQ